MEVYMCRRCRLPTVMSSSLCPSCDRMVRNIMQQSSVRRFWGMTLTVLWTIGLAFAVLWYIWKFGGR